MPEMYKKHIKPTNSRSFNFIIMIYNDFSSTKEEEKKQLRRRDGKTDQKPENWGLIAT